MSAKWISFIIVNSVTKGLFAPAYKSDRLQRKRQNAAGCSLPLAVRIGGDVNFNDIYNSGH